MDLNDLKLSTKNTPYGVKINYSYSALSIHQEKH